MASLHTVTLAVIWFLRIQTVSSIQVIESGDRTITSVVKLLQSMLEHSRTEGDTERELYAKYKCYVDDNEMKKKSEIASLTEEIELLKSQIDGLLASNSLMSKETAQLQADMEENELARNKSISVRQKENFDFKATEADLEIAIDRLNESIHVLAEVGADQTLQAARDHNVFMAGHKVNLGQLQTSVQKALLAASAFVSPSKVATISSLIQKPFTGSYVSQAGEVVGILKDMHTTFTANLEAAQEAERVAQEAHDKYIDSMVAAHGHMSASYNEKQGLLSVNDADLSTKKSQLNTAKISLSDAESFLDTLLTMYRQKKAEYEQRLSLRAEEQTAITEAIAILNSDAAFATFGTVTATKEGPLFLELSTEHGHIGDLDSEDAFIRQKAEAFLQKTADAKNIRVVGRIVSMLKARNPFTAVLEEIDTMIELIANESLADTQQKIWCETTRSDYNGRISTKNSEIGNLESEIDQLNTTINDPVTGLRKSLADNEKALQENSNSQMSETAQRKEENLAYRKDIANLVEATELVKKAIAVLSTYYAKIRNDIALMQKHAQPSPPPTWTGDYKGQGDNGKNAISMLQTILSNTEAEEKAAHQAELSAQTGYENSMATLKGSQKTLEGAIAQDKADLAQKLKDKFEREKDLKATEAEKASFEAYLESIKAGCDFIEQEYDNRESARSTETAALSGAKQLLQTAPVYITAVAAAHNETLGGCLSICTGREDHVECKACLAETSVPGYCAGHPGTTGC